MRRPTLPRRPVVVLAAAALVLTACGADDATSATTTTAAAPTTTAAATTTIGAPTTIAAPTTVADASTTTAGPAAPVASTSIPTTSAPAIDSGLRLLADGLGVVDFQATYAETLDALREALGEPDDIGAGTFEPAIGSMQSVTWGHLRVDFTGGAGQLYFTGYLLARPMEVVEDEGTYRFTLPEWAPAPWEPALATEAGVALDTTAAAAAETYPAVYAARCNNVVEETTLLVDDGTTDQLFVTPEQAGVYLQRPIGGVVWAIGAQLSPNPLLCDGALG